MILALREADLAVKIYSADQADLTRLSGKVVSILGYGNQGRAHALNLQDSGIKVIVGQRPEGPGWRKAEDDGFKPLPVKETVDGSDLIIVALPDMAAPAVYDEQIGPRLRPGQTLGFIHGFNIHYGRIKPPADVDVIMVAPKGAGYMVRQKFCEGGGLPALVAVEQDASGQALATALAWAKGIGAGRAGIIQTSFATETETDLFGEQVSVVGGVTALMKAAFEVLVEAGYEPESAYFECVQEVKYVVDLIHDHGFGGMRERISDTAEYGGLTRSPRLEEVAKPLMRRILGEIRSGQFAKEWIAEHAAGCPRQQSMHRVEQESLIEQTGARLRKLSEGSTNA